MNHHHRNLHRWFLGALVLACGSAHVRGADLVVDAQPAVLKARAQAIAYVPMSEQPITVNGQLDEAEWKQAAVVREWTDCATGNRAGIKAEMRVIATKEFMCFGFTMQGTKGLVLQKPTDKGGDEYGGSVLELFLDPNSEGRTSVQIVTNPLGLRYDKYDWRADWTGKWQAAGVVEPDQWTIEIAVPYSELNNQHPGVRQFWKANFGLTLRRATEEMYSWTGGWKEAATDYGILYFGSREQYEKSITPRVELFLDREVYDLRDGAAVALTRLDAIPGALDKMALLVSLRQGEQTLAQERINKLAGPDMQYTLSLQPYKAGEYTVQVEVLKDGKPIAKVERALSRQDRHVQPAAAAAGKIPIRVHAQKELGGNSWPINTGVPFAQGSLAAAENVRLLDPAGAEVPHQTSVRATWGPHGPVQWLGLDFIPTLSAEQQVYVLEYGPKVKAADKPEKLQVEQTADVIKVNTGPLQFTVDRKHFALVSTATINGKQVIGAQDGAGLSLVDHMGQRYTSVEDTQAQVTVEEQGPVRTTICAKGWYVKQGSKGERTSVELPTDRLCQFTVRLSAFAGSPLIKVAVSTTMTQDTDKVRLRELTIGVPVQGNDVRVGDYPLAEQGYLLQDRWDRAVDATGKEYPRLDGWIQTPDLRIAVRRFWQLFPKEIGHTKGLLTIHPWPAHGHDVFAMDDQIKMENIYKLWFAHQGPELNFKFPEPYTKTLDDYLGAHKGAFSPYYKDMSFSNAQGLTIHNDLLLAFGGTLPGATAAALVNVDPHAVAEPEYACATNVFGPILHADPQFAELERTYKRGFMHLVNRQDPANEYGMFIFANWHNIWNYAPRFAHVQRVWGNTHYLIPRIPFVQYARTGDPDWMIWGHDNSAIARDVGMVHYVSKERAFPFHRLGAQYHVKGFAPWAGDAHVAAHPICLDYLVYDYFLFGNRRSLDAVNDWVSGIKESSPGGYGTREGQTTLGELLTVYQLTWDPGLIELIERFRKAITRVPLDPSTWDYHPMLCARDWAFSGDAKMLERFREAVRDVGGHTGGGMIHYAGLFSMIDNDPKALEATAAMLYRSSMAIVDRPGEYGDGLTRNMWYEYGNEAHKYPYALKAIKHFGVALERPRITRPAPQVAAEGRTLIVVKETADQEIAVKLNFNRVPEGEITVRVFRADGTPVAQGKRPVQKDSTQALELNVPVDGKTSEYLIEIQRTYEYDAPAWPVSNVPHEVALMPAKKPTIFWVNADGLRVYVSKPMGAPAHLGMYCRSSNAIRMDLLDAQDKVLTSVNTSEYIGGSPTMEIPAQAELPLSFYITSPEVRFTPLEDGPPWALALTPEALFTPTMTETPGQ